MICFDSIEAWEPSLSQVLSHLAPINVQQSLQKQSHQFLEDATDHFLSLADRDKVIDSVLTWLRSNSIAAYHGTRLTPDEVNSIKANGLIPLDATERHVRLKRALSRHPRWPNVAHMLDEEIQSMRQGNAVGSREGQVHLTLSNYGLTNHFNHYLTHGSEFDWHVAQALLGDEGRDLLTRDGDSFVIQVEIPGEIALAAAHPWGSIKDVRAKGDLPNILKEFLNVWCFRLVRPEFTICGYPVDSGMVLRQTIPPKWIRDIQPWINRQVR
jgi:hypothetical protein